MPAPPGAELDTTGPPAVLRPAGPQPPGHTDADYTISADTARRLQNATPGNTRRAYDRNWDQFLRWCDGERRTPLPATAQTLAGYVARLAGSSLSPATIDQAIGTIRSKHRRAGYKQQPDTEAALALLRAYRREWADEGGRARKATPVLLDALRAMTGACDPAALAGLRDRAVLLLGFNGMCRRSELSALNIGDLSEAGGDGLTMRIRRSKTDQDAQGAEVAVPYGQHEQTCAVRAVRAWLDALARRGVTAGPLFRPIDRHGRVGGEKGYAGRGEGRLTGESISQIVHRRARDAGLQSPGGYTGHSLRSGAATSAYLAGAPVAQIAQHGRWTDKSPVVLGYIRAVDKWQHNPMKGIGL